MMSLGTPALCDSEETIARQVLDSGHSSLDGITFDELRTRGWMQLTYPDPFVPFAQSFPTPSGKLEFVSDKMVEAGLDTVAGYTPSQETSQTAMIQAGDYPLTLITLANHYFLNSTFANISTQQRRSGTAMLLIHPDDAACRRIISGDDVRVSNLRGSFYAVADVSDRTRLSMVFAPQG